MPFEIQWPHNPSYSGLFESLDQEWKDNLCPLWIFHLVKSNGYEIHSEIKHNLLYKGHTESSYISAMWTHTQAHTTFAFINPTYRVVTHSWMHLCTVSWCRELCGLLHTLQLFKDLYPCNAANKLWMSHCDKRSPWATSHIPGLNRGLILLIFLCHSLYYPLHLFPPN